MVALALLASLIAWPATANEPAQLGHTLELRTDGPFTKPVFRVIRSQAELEQTFGGQPPRASVDFRAGPLVLFAWRPGGKVPLIVDLAAYPQRTDVRIKPTSASLLEGRLTGQGQGAPYHLVQLTVPVKEPLRPAVAQRTSLLAALRLDDQGAHLRQLHRYQGRGMVMIRKVAGDTLTVSPADRSHLSAEIPASWIGKVMGGTARPGARAVINVPDGEAMTLPGYRLHPTDPELATRLQRADDLLDQVLKLSGDLYLTRSYADQGIDVHSIDRQRPGEEPITVQASDDAARVARALDLVFPLQADPQGTSSTDRPSDEDPKAGLIDGLSNASGQGQGR
jgi:hypothetical protein